MKTSEQTLQQLDRAISKIADKFPSNVEAQIPTDIHIRVVQESGELLVFDDDDIEITRVVIEQWIDNKDEDFFHDVTDVLRQTMYRNRQLLEGMSILKPFSFVLEDDEKESVAELFIADDDTVIIGADIMADLSEDLDAFFEKLMSE